MTPTILILSVWISTSNIGGYTVTTQEFNSKYTCEKAKQVISEQIKDGSEFKIDCVEK